MSSNRGNEWKEFSEKVYNHVEGYTVPQYGDSPNDQAETWSAADCALAIKKYSARFGSNAREGQQELDFLKMAHYACLGYNKYLKEKTEAKESDTVTISRKEYEELLMKLTFLKNLVGSLS